MQTDKQYKTETLNQSDEHFLLANFTDDHHCHICGHILPMHESWHVDGLVIYDKGAVAPAITVRFHINCMMNAKKH